MIQLETGHVIAIITAYCGSMFAFGKLLMAQYEKRLSEKFAHFDKEFSELREADKAREREVLDLRVSLPNTFVRREDYIRGEAVLHAKIDSLASKIDVVSERMLRAAARLPDHDQFR